ncbi:MAG: TolC family protein, partial [Acidobacteria bacterium]|nr:TolC family protein [Acidobacteriota bacterium]
CSSDLLTRPDLQSSVTGVQIDSESADASFGLQPEKSAAAKLSARQVLFSDAVQANIAIQRHLFEASGQAYRAQRLDLTLEITERYFDFLKAHNLYQVRRDNLDRTSSHLETAKTRKAVGLANPAEVYRWQAQLANDKLASIEARNQADQALYALNRLLGAPQEQPLQGLMPDMMDPEMRSNFARITQYVGNEHEFERFRAFMVQEALRDAPELARIQALMNAQKRSLQTANRAFYLPTIALQGSLENEFYRSDSENPLLNLLPPGTGAALPTAPDTSWNVALQFSLPLYSGGKRHQDQALAQFGLDRLELQRQEVSEQLELRVRASLQALASTSVGIQLREEAAQAALKSLELMEDAYAQGVASPIDLIDSQNTALVAQIAATNARHDYFLALMRFQRASGNFDVFLTAQEREAFYQRLNTFYATEKE